MTGTCVHLSDVIWCIVSGRTGELALWLRNGQNPDASIQQDGRTLLHLSAEYGNFEAFEMLLAHGADVHATSADGRSLLYFASLGVLHADGKNPEGAAKILRRIVERYVFPNTEKRRARRILRWVAKRSDLASLLDG